MVFEIGVTVEEEGNQTGISIKTEVQIVNWIDLETFGEEIKEDDEDVNRLFHLLIY